MPLPPDPFTAAHQAIFAAFKGHPPLAAMVGLGNFVDTTDPLFQQFKPDAQAGDLPRVMVLQDAFTLPPFGGCSTAVEFSQAYRVLFATDVLRVVPLNQLKYQALCALVKAGPDLGLPFVRAFDVGPGKDESKRPDDKTQRWTAAFAITVRMYVARRVLAGT